MNRSLQEMRAEIVKSIGQEKIDDLHRENRLLDALAVLALTTAYVSAFVVVHTYSAWWVGVAVAITQGITMTLLGLLNHDLLVHRRALGRRGSLILGTILTAPIQLHFSRYRKAHLKHHLRVQREDDPEAYKKGISSLSRRLLFCTAIGLKLAVSGAWSPDRRPYLSVDDATPKGYRTFEILAHILFLVCMVALAFISFRTFLFAFLLPLLLVVPTLNTLRILIEHAHIQDSEGPSIATYYRTGPISRPLFLWDAGDCHFVHHIYANIPFYRIAEAIAVFAPLFDKWGIRQSPAYSELLRSWFVDSKQHGKDWSKKPASRNDKSPLGVESP